jgi:hypothetical protein
MTYLCHLEAVNLMHLFGDCHDLSTIRGGGLSVLQIGSAVSGAQVISSGASQGLLLVEAASREEAVASVRGAVGRHLGGLAPYATVMVEALEYDASQFGIQRQQLRAAIRKQQMQSPTVAYPPLGEGDICDIDHVRGARARTDMAEPEGPEDRPHRVLSDFTYLRRKRGLEDKKQLLRRILHPDFQTLETATDLEQMVKDGPFAGNCADKIAVLRFDGNDFGTLSSGFARPEELQTFSDRVKAFQEDYFRRLLDPAQPRHAWWWGPGNRLRLEVIVYGGDEVSIAVPAALGFPAAKVFYEALAEMEPMGERRLTYSGGLVICHHNAPIHAIRDLAGELADAAKGRAKASVEDGGKGGKGNWLAYQVLESFDHVGRDLDKHLDERFAFCGGRGILLSPDAIGKYLEHMEYLRAKISRRKLHAMAVSPPAGGCLAHVGSLVEDSRMKKEEVLDVLRELHGEVGSDAAFLHVLELWDYIDPEEKG